MNNKIFKNSLMFFIAFFCLIIPVCAVDLQPGSDGEEQTVDPQLQKALGHLARAIAMKQSHDLDAAISEYLKGVSVSPEVTKYSDEGIVLDIIKKYKSIVDSHGNAASASGADKETIDALKQQVEDLTAENKELQNRITSLENQDSGKDEEYEKEIERLKAENERLDHMRAVYKGRWLREKD